MVTGSTAENSTAENYPIPGATHGLQVIKIPAQVDVNGQPIAAQTFMVTDPKRLDATWDHAKKLVGVSGKAFLTEQRVIIGQDTQIEKDFSVAPIYGVAADENDITVGDWMDQPDEHITNLPFSDNEVKIYQSDDLKPADKASDDKPILLQPITVNPVVDNKLAEIKSTMMVTPPNLWKRVCRQIANWWHSESDTGDNW